MESEELSMHEAYKNFCSKHPLKKLSMPKSDLVWCYYDINSRNDNIIVFLHGICGTAGCYFYQLDKLSNLGFRVISFQYPCYNYLKDWIKNMCNILEYLNIKKAHFFASDLGGYLIQLYAKLYPSKIQSLILCNSYRKTDDFAAIASLRNIYGKLYSFLPHVLLKKIILENYIYINYVNIDLKEKNSLEFMSNEIDLISASDLGGRISLQLSSDIIDRIYVNDKCITILQTLNNMYSDSLNEDMKKAYPFAKHAIMKSGGDFPYLSRYEEVNMYILVHLRNNCNASFVKEQISNMSYIHQQKNEDDNEQISEKKKYTALHYRTNENNYNSGYSNSHNNVDIHTYKEKYITETSKYQIINNNINNNYQKYDSHLFKNGNYTINEDNSNNRKNKDNYDDEENSTFCKNNTSNYYIKQNSYEEQNGNHSTINNYINDNYSFSNNSNAFSINHNDCNYIDNNDNYRNKTNDTCNYNNINDEYTYINTSNENFNKTDKNINISEESYNKESINYQDNFNQNDAGYNHTNINQNDIFCHF
ncbi:acid cluster protein 33 homologue, putative [Plasmodium relictum]|uniref:Maspardin n=1 Tax=Plasmodium relictum TaxID=85471 RepID=A0A1J1HA58_PLARL|nr:acid cluster protein 33 homologue, putative [Plasmodium relictum]CRH01510.1 acid cluster protein 33 homologue, putative [Plasmodium relictum]